MNKQEFDKLCGTETDPFVFEVASSFYFCNNLSKEEFVPLFIKCWEIAPTLMSEVSKFLERDEATLLSTHRSLIKTNDDLRKTLNSIYARALENDGDSIIDLCESILPLKTRILIKLDKNIRLTEEEYAYIAGAL